MCYAPISTNAAGRTLIAEKPPLPPPEKQALYEALQPDTCAAWLETLVMPASGE